MTDYGTMIAWLAGLTPLVGVPLTVILFYLRGLRDQARSGLADVSRRVEVLSAAGHAASTDLVRVQRDYTTKEEWLRESMWARNRIETLCASLARMESVLEGTGPLLAEARRCAHAARACAARGETDPAGAGLAEGE